MTNKENLIRLPAEDFYRKMRRLFMTMSKSEIIMWLNDEVSEVTPNNEKRISGKHACPYCGQCWVWSQSRWNKARMQGYLIIKCRSCANDFMAYREEDGIVNERLLE